MTDAERKDRNFDAMMDALGQGKDSFTMILPDWANWDMADATPKGFTFADTMRFQRKRTSEDDRVRKTAAGNSEPGNS